MQREQVKREKKHTSAIVSHLRDLQKTHNQYIQETDEEVNGLYIDITDAQEEIKAVAAEKMQILFKINRCEQEVSAATDTCAYLVVSLTRCSAFNSSQ